MKRLCQFRGWVSCRVLLVVLLFGITELFSQNIPQGALNGKFSVSENGDMVQFSQGNLQYIGSANTPYWKFAEHQWDYIGSTKPQNSVSTYVDRDLFGWGTSGYNHGAYSYRPWSVSPYSSEYYAYGNSLYDLNDQTGKADWGYNRISNGGNTENTWRTLTKNEWDYLFNSRNTTSGIRYALAQVNNVGGVILLPDNWNESYYSLNSINSYSGVSFGTNIITASQWNTLEQHGAVFLPAAGGRQTISLISLGSIGYYWSATHMDNTGVYDLCFGPGIVNTTDYSSYRGYGFSVRLVCDTQDYSYNINAAPDPADGGSVSGSGTYVNGSTCTVTANPNPEYYFVVWTENGTQVSTDAEYTFTVDKDRLLVAHFQQQTYTISVSHFPSAGGSVMGGGNFTYGNQCTVTASANSGFHFVNWTENGNQVSTNETYTFDVTNPRELVANFVLDNVGPEQIAFADANVKAICVANWDTNGDGELSYSEAASVTSIGTKFEKNTTITSFDEFQYFTGVTTLVGGLKPSGTPGITLQYGAFYCCSNLTSIIIPDNVTEIKSYGFSGCSGLTSLTVKATTPPTLGNNVFSNVPKNIPVYVPCAAVTAYMTASGWSEFTNYQGIDCVYHQIYVSANPVEGGTVTGGGTYIQGTSCTVRATACTGYAFVSWTVNGTLVSTNATYTFNVTGEKTLVANFTQINPDEIIVFADANVKAICVANWDTNGDGELSYDEAAAVMTLGTVFSKNTTITTFNELQYFTGLTQINGGYSFVNIGNNTMQEQPFGAFVGCTNLTSIILPNTVTLLSCTFNGCESLTSLEIPSEVTRIGRGTFSHCYSLTSIEIPNAVASIEREAFCECTGLTTVDIGSSVVTIGNNAFYGCSHLASMTVRALTPPSLGTNVFNNVVKSIPVSVFNVVIETYQAANGWSEFTNYHGMECIYHQISASANPTEGGTVTGAGACIEGTGCVLTAINNPGYAFVNWTENGTVISTNVTYTVNVTGERFLVANFIQTNPNEIISFADDNVRAICVSHWDTNGDSEVSYDEAASVTDLELAFKNNSSVISFDELQYFIGLTALGPNASKGGSTPHVPVYPPVISTIYGEFYNCQNLTSIILPNNLTSIGSIAFKDCHNLISIEIPCGVTMIDKQAFYNCSGLTTLTIRSETPPTLNADVFYGVNKSIPVYVPAGKVATYQAASGWSEFTNIQEIPVPSYEITATANPFDGGTITGTGLYNHGTSCTLTATPATGYSFVNWTENGIQVSETPTYTFNVTGERNLVANFNLNGYEIIATANPIEGGTVTGAGTYNEGGSCTLTATSNTGFAFVNWTEDGNPVSTEAVYTFTVTDDRNLVANFSPVSYEISVAFNPINSGEVVGTGSYLNGESCTLIVTPNEGYTFVNWTENGNQVSTDTEYTFTVTGTRDLVANFSLNSYTVSTLSNPTAGGTTTGEGTYSHGTTCTLTATPNEGYTFINWTENGNHVSTDAEYTFTVTGTRTLVANFSLNIYTVSVLANQAEGGTVTGGGSYNHGTSCTLTATANTGYTFVSWTKDGITVSTDPEYCFTVTEAATYIAEFETDEVTSNHWIPQSANYADNMALYCVIMIHGEEQTSDQLEVGAFCGDECRGSAMASLFEITNRYLVVLMVFGNNGDQIQFKLYDHATGQELNYTSSEIVTFQEDGYGTPLEPYVLDFVDNAQNRALIAGWNWYSTYIEQNGIDGLTMLENSLGTSGIRIQGRNGMVDYFEYQGDSYWYGSLNSIANEQMYKIRTSEACDAVMVGYLASAANHPITINNGWNWIGFPSNQSVSVTTALSGFTPEADDIIKGRNGMAAYVAGSDLWYGTLNMLEPGQGYMYKSNANTAKTLTINTERGENMIANMTSENNIFIPNDAEFASNMLVTAVVDMEGNELHSEDYELASFVGDECRGSVKLMYVEPIDRYVAFLLVFGEANEDIHFALTDGTETRWSNTTMVYSADAIIGTLSEPTTICFGTMGVEDNTELKAVIYPNPTNDLLNVKCEVLNKIELVNAYGQRVLTKQVRTDNLQIDLGNLAPGIYLLRLSSEFGMTTKQIIKQ